MVTGIDWIEVERERQVSREGYDAAHDAAHNKGELIRAAIVYLGRAVSEAMGVDLSLDFFWPWRESERNDRAGSTRLLIIAGALIAAEIDRRIAAGEERFVAALSEVERKND
jgi:hypothetical protein